VQARTVTEEARRSQIVDAAIAVIAESGYPRATFAEIARRAGLSSTGLISYHFAGKEDLITQVAWTVMQRIGGYMTEVVGAERTPSARLRAYIVGTVTFIADHRADMRALLEIVLNGALKYDATDAQQVLSPLEQILADGQRAGEFRDFDVRIVASAVQRSLEGVQMLLEAHPDLDPKAYAEELVTVFDLATRAAG
jgi:AcrR family transcriptional regulator